MSQHENHFNSMNNGIQAGNLRISGGEFNFNVGHLLSVQERCLQSLAFPNMYTRGDLEPKTPGTCEWLLQHSNYKQWHERGGIFWLNGRAGSGKSTLMASVYKQASELHVGSSSLVMSFFFSRRGEELHCMFLGLLRSLLHQLLSHRAELLREFVASSDFIELCKREGKPGHSWVWSVDELQRSFLRFVRKCSSIGHVRLYVDGIDETGDDHAIKVVQYITKLTERRSSMEPGVSVLFACRPHPYVIWTRDFTVHVEKENRADIQNFISKALAGNLDVETREYIKSELCKRAHGVFRWVTLNMPRILQYCAHRDWKVNPQNVLQQIRTLPEGLNETYIDIFSALDRHEAAEAFRAFFWVTFYGVAMSVQLFQQAMFFEGVLPSSMVSLRAFENDEFVSWLSNVGRGLLITVEDDDGDSDAWSNKAEAGASPSRVQMDHQSVREFMLERGLAYLSRLSSDTDETKTRLLNPHSYMTKVCSKVCWEVINGKLPNDSSVRIYALEGWASVSWLHYATIAQIKESSPWSLLDLTLWPSTRILERIRLAETVPATLLHIAAFQGWQDVVREIAHRDGRSFQWRVSLGVVRELHRARTPLETAAEWGKPQIVIQLLGYGAIPTHRAIELATRGGHGQTVQPLESAL